MDDMKNPHDATAIPAERRLEGYIDGLLAGEERTALYRRYQETFRTSTPEAVFEAFYVQLKKGRSAEELLAVLSKVIKLLAAHMPAFDRSGLEKDSFLALLIRENEELTGRLDRFKDVIVAKGTDEALGEAAALAEGLLTYELHLVKKENILFPMMEKKKECYEGLAIMWALHDEIRACLKESVLLFGDVDGDLTAKTAMLGRIYFLLYGLVEKENLLLFPAASVLLTQTEQETMKRQAREIGFAFGIVPEIPEASPATEAQTPGNGMYYTSPTGTLTFEQLTGILNHLPVDISFVDENNRLTYFNAPKERIFPRSPASIGRNVRNCHPPKSVDTVDRIIEAFRNNTRDSATFWIRMKGRLILIEYYAVRDAEGVYRGVLEASRDVTDIQSLSGEKRLLDF